MRITLSLIFITFFAIQEISAQFNYHRTYPVSGRSEIALGITTTGDGYYTYNGVLNLVNELRALNVSKLDLKGEVTWSRDLTVEDDWALLGDGEIVNLENDTIALCIILNQIEGEENLNVIIKLDPNGEVVWVKGSGGYEGYTLDPINYPITIKARPDNSVVVATTYTVQGEAGLSTYSIDPNGEVNWSNRSAITDTFGVSYTPVTFGSAMAEDSALIVAGYVSDFVSFVDASLIKVDSVGEPSWMKTYPDSLGGLNVVNDVAFLSDTTYAIAGINQSITGQQNGMVIRTDIDGNLIWSKQIELGGLMIATLVNSITETELGSIVVSGVVQDEILQTSNTFQVKLDRNGELIWGKTYPRAFGLNAQSPNIVPIAEDGTAYWGQAANVTSAFSHFIVADSLGNAGGSMAPIIDQCAQEIPDSVVVDWPTGQIDLVLTTVQDTAIVDYMAESNQRAIGFDIPTITLVDSMFCPNVPIFVIEDATVEGADSYLWNTEETTPTIEVEEEGNPIVEVTINDERGCFTLCDTATISVLDSTMVSLQVDDSVWCETRELLLTAFPSGGLAPYDITWSTGDSVPQIGVEIQPDETITVSVDVIEQCEILATQTVNLQAPDIDPSDYTLAWNIDRYCATGEIELQLYDGIFNNIIWYDALGNELPELQGPNPVITEFGTYSFTALDTCNFELADMITVPNGLPEPQEIMIDFDVDRACATGELQLELNGPVASGLSNVRWFDSAGMVLGNNLSVIVPDYGTYSVLAIDACQNEIGDEITISLDNLPTTDIILIADDTISCSTGLLRIRIEDPTGLSNVVWSSGQTNVAEIFIDDFEAEYTVTANFCQQSYTSNTVSPSITTENFVKWPNAFYPNYTAEMGTDARNNRTFGPYIVCPPAVENYELRIYNQYGNLMFETNDPTEFWDGTKDGDVAPGDVYVWYATYEVSTITEELNGTATLIR